MILDVRKKILATVRAAGPVALEQARQAARAPRGQAEVPRPDDAFEWSPVGVVLPAAQASRSSWLVELRDRYRRETAQGRNPFFSPDHGQPYDENLRQSADNLVGGTGGIVDRLVEHIQTSHAAGSWPFGEATLGKLKFPAATTVDVSKAFQRLSMFAGGGKQLDKGLRARSPDAVGTVLIQLNGALSEVGLALVDWEVSERRDNLHCEVVVRDLPLLALALALDPLKVRPEAKRMQPIDDIGLERLHLEEQSRRIGSRQHFEH